MHIITNENITSKQRSKLKSLASTLSPVTQIGKSGITDNLLKTLSDALEARELIKVTILDTAEDAPRDIADNVAELLNAVPVAVIGRKAIFYRYSSRQNFAHLEI
ncbi:MAG: YhbY family RNA-binding protein [Clostridia bacterium]|nr:YhbY family RNA-binding protein [Clostridia bacterium]